MVSITGSIAPTLPSRVLLQTRLRDSPRLPVLRLDNLYLRRASMNRHAQTTALSRRTFLATTGVALVGAALGELTLQSEAAKRHPKRGGVLQFGTRLDTAGLDSHRNTQYHVSHPIAAMYTGLADIDQQGNIVPGIAESWEPNKELTSWVFRLHKGVLFHNGREVDAEAVKLNILRLKDPAIGGEFQRGAVETIETIDILDKHTVRVNLREPDVSLPSNVMHFPDRKS